MDTDRWDRRGVLRTMSLAAAGVLDHRATSAGQVFGGDHEAEVEGAGQRCRLPSSRLRRPVPDRSHRDAQARRRACRRLSRAAETDRDHPQRARAALDLWHRQPLPPRRARGIRTERAHGRGSQRQVSTDELQRMHALGVRGIRFNLAQAGATTPEMIEPLSKRVNDLGWHIQINAPGERIMAIMPILERVPSQIVFDHLAHIPQPEGVNHPLFAKVRGLHRQWPRLGEAIGRLRRHEGRSADLCGRHAVARAYVKAAPERLVWGSDWPHPTERRQLAGRRPPVRSAADWAPDEKVRHRSSWKTRPCSTTSRHRASATFSSRAAASRKAQGILYLEAGSVRTFVRSDGTT